MAGAADQPFDMDFSGAAPSAAAPVPAQSSGAADQPFDMNFSGGAASAPQAPAPTPAPSSTTFNANNYYAALANDYIRRTDASSASQTQSRVDQVMPSADPRTAKVQAMQPNGRPHTALDDTASFLGGSWNKFANDVQVPYNSAKEAFAADLARANDPPPPKNFVEKYVPGFSPQSQAELATVRDVAAGVVSPVTGLWNGFVTQPLAGALDQLPAPYKAPTLINGKVRADRMTPAEQHAANEQVINNALMALGPEGAEVGSVAKLADAKNAANISSVTSKVPAEVAVTPSGKLTDEGLEHARNANVDPRELETAYRNQRASQQFAQSVAPKPPAPAAPAPEPAASQPPPQPAPAPITTADDASAAARPAVATPEPVAAEALDPAPQAIWHGPEGEHPVEVTGEPQAGPGGRPYAPVRSMVHGGEGWVPAEELAPAADAEVATVANSAAGSPGASEVRIGPDGRTIFGERPEDVPTSRDARMAEAQGVGVNLSEGQASRDFAAQDAEERLAASDEPQSNAARQFRTQQQDAVANAVEDIRQTIADPTLTEEERGLSVQNALRNLKQQGLAGASAAYTEGKNIAAAMGEHGAELMRLDTGDLATALRNVLMDETVEPQARAALRQLAAQYGLIGKTAKTYEDGAALVNVLDHEGKPGRPIMLPRKPEPLTFQNAEEFRQGVNRIYRKYEEPGVLPLNDKVDAARDAAFDRVAADGKGDLAGVMKKARALYRQNKLMFEAKDLIQDLTDWKIDGITPKVSPEAAIQKLARAEPSVLKRFKGTLMQSAEGRAAMQNVKAQVIDNLFKQARVVNADGGRGAFSADKLNLAMLRFGIERLRIILSESEFNQLNQFRRVLANVTQKADYINNASNSGNVMARFVKKYGTTLIGKAVRDIPVVGGFAEAGSNYGHMVAEDAANEKTLQGMINPKR